MSDNKKKVQVINDIYLACYNYPESVFYLDPEDKKLMSNLNKYEQNQLLEFYCYCMALNNINLSIVESDTYPDIFTHMCYLVDNYKLTLKNVQAK